MRFGWWRRDRRDAQDESDTSDVEARVELSIGDLGIVVASGDPLDTVAAKALHLLSLTRNIAMAPVGGTVGFCADTQPVARPDAAPVDLFNTTDPVHPEQEEPDDRRRT